MRLSLGENIKKYRKQFGLTQENLAEAMGVSVGSVSKWESGNTAPELTMLAALAEFYETSVDALLGYAAAPRGADAAITRIQNAMTARDWTTGRMEVAKALQKYPNHFATLHQSARFCFLCGLVEADHDALEQSLSLYERALTLLNLNTDAKVREYDLQCEISRVYLALGQENRAIELLEQCNYSGVNQAQIGAILVQQGLYADAAGSFSSSLLDCVVKLFYTATGLADCYAASKDHAKAAELLDWACSVFDALNGERVNYLWLLASRLYARKACLYAALRDMDLAEASLRRAWELAKAFDAAPDYRIDGMRFYCGKPGFAYDNLGATAESGIVAALDSLDAEACSQLRAMLDRRKEDADAHSD